MAGQRTVLIDPDGTLPDWAFVVVERATGVLYQHQYGGTACRLGEVEGYLVPVDGVDARRRLDDVFVRRLKGVGSWGKPLEHELLESVRGAIAAVRYWPDSQGSPTVEELRVDEERLGEIDEGWVPVVTSDGRGVFLWPNSD